MILIKVDREHDLLVSVAESRSLTSTNKRKILLLTTKILTRTATAHAYQPSNQPVYQINRISQTFLNRVIKALITDLQMTTVDAVDTVEPHKIRPQEWSRAYAAHGGCHQQISLLSI
ncbi:unnamed protein product [Ceratitis capitata]|uniref:(Mediterranean fruit fly) hypothetical protein n=1 Tax=Ceratitis capitata TaxID=7213 RepID=A0A811VGT2_CERCA|nr:unnamed protein product [Ceratitis capitata]